MMTDCDVESRLDDWGSKRLIPNSGMLRVGANSEGRAVRGDGDLPNLAVSICSLNCFQCSNLSYIA